MLTVLLGNESFNFEGLNMATLRQFRVVLSLVLLTFVGCGPQTAKQKLLGRWKATPAVHEAVDAAVSTAAGGQEVDPLTRGATRFLGNVIARATLSVEVDFRDTGKVFFRGSTDMLGLPPDSDGEWRVVASSPDEADIEMSVDGKTLPAAIVFRDADEISFKPGWTIEMPKPKPVELPPELAAAKNARQGRFEEPKAVVEPPAQKPPSSLIFKRDS
jgi:hypothetical protein